VVLDAMLQIIQASLSVDLASTLAFGRGRVSVGIVLRGNHTNGSPKLMCMTRLNTLVRACERPEQSRL